MARTQIALVGALSLGLLASCGGQVSASSENDASVAETNALENAGPIDPGELSAPAGNEAETVPPPDAVSHPDGYLPPVDTPAEPAEADPPGAKAPPATEDEYMRNRQGR